MIAAPDFFANLISGLRRGAHLRHGAWRGFRRVGPHGLDRIDHDQRGHRAFRQRGDDVLDGRFRGSCTGASAQAETPARSRTCATASSPEM